MNIITNVQYMLYIVIQIVNDSCSLNKQVRPAWYFSKYYLFGNIKFIFKKKKMLK